jgi:hypothetical protein
MEDLQFPGKETVVNLVVMDQEQAHFRMHTVRIIALSARPHGRRALNSSRHLNDAGSARDIDPRVFPSGPGSTG